MNLLPEGEYIEPIEIPHEFETDLHCLVTANHGITMEAIRRAEEKDLEESQRQLGTGVEYDFVSSVITSLETFYEDLRVAATNMAVVGLVTRVQHWIAKYIHRCNPTHKIDSLPKNFSYLSAQLGKPPEDTEEFVKLEEVRDSVIHHDSKPGWVYRDQPHDVDPQFVPNQWRVEVSEDQLAIAIKHAITIITWYDEQLRARNK